MLIIFWFVIAVLAAVFEIASPTFGAVFVSVAALAAAAAAALGLVLPGQVLVFGICLAVCLLALRPRLVAKLGSRGVPSRTDRLVGVMGQVSEAIDPVLGRGRVTVAGEDWAARSATAAPVGSQVVVEGADGIVLHVRVVPAPEGPRASAS